MTPPSPPPGAAAASSCPRCGSPVPPDGRFCERCGATIEPPAPRRRGRTLARRLRVAGIVLAVAGILGGAAWVGWALNDALGDDPEVVVRRDIRLVTDAPVADGTAPSVVGLDRAAARQAFADAGARPDAIRVVEEPYAGDAGLVIEQRPAPAEQLASSATLTVSAPATMPDFAGRPRDEARDRLEALGAVVRTKAEFVPGAGGDEVIRTIPGPGSRVLEEVTLVYAEPESSVALADLTAESSDCEQGDRSMGGADRTNAVVCTAYDEPSAAVYRLDGHATRFAAEVGLDDDAPPDAVAVARVTADGRTVARAELEPGEVATVDAGVAGVRRLSLEVRARGDEVPDVVWADAALYGSRRGLDALTG